MIPSLNPEQKKAVEHGVGPLLIVAGAGTGKTTVITERIRYLIEEKKVKPSNILALTFTEKAAEEMLNRVDEAMPLGYEEPWLSTFHSFCDRVLRLEALEIGLDPSYKILTSPEQWLIIRKHLFEFDLKIYRPLGNPTKFISALLQLFSRAKDEAVDADEFEKYASTVKSTDLKTEEDEEEDSWQEKKEKLVELSKAYQKYREILIAENALDFGDLILWTIKLFKSRPSVLAKYRNQFKFILVDEFQDTNFAQYELIKLLAPASKKPNLVVVGDDDQSIYRFRSASVSNILDFKKDYPDAKTVVLTKNYRSTQAILDSAYKMIQNNNPDRLEVKIKINKKLISERPKTKQISPQIFVSLTAELEADKIINKIIELSKKYLLKDFAVLARANNHLDPIISSLKRSQIPYSLIGNRGLFDTEEVRQLIAYLKVLVNKDDSPSVYFLLISSIFGFKPDEVTEFLNLIRKEKITAWEALKKSDTPQSRKLIETFESENQKIHTLHVVQLLYRFIKNTGFIERFTKEESVENSLKIKNVNLFFDKVKKFESESDNPTVFEFVNYLEMLISAGENPAQAEIEDIDTVKLLTVHSAKGLEFPVVFIVSLTSDRFPTRERGEAISLPIGLIKETLPYGDAHLEEERRLFYVGATRAKDELYLSYAKNYGGVKEKKLSGFVKELGLEEKFTERSTQQSIFINNSKSISKKTLDLKYISYSQIETFQTCPLKYKYRYVLGIPGAPNHALNFGQTLHRTLRDFHKYELLDKNPTIDDLLTLYKNHWIGEGYESKEHKMERFEEGKRILSEYYKSYKKVFGHPLYLEQKFTIRLNGTFLIGSIDRIDKIDNKIEIIDYKTGEGKLKKKEIKKDSQLTIYALAANESLGINPDFLSLYFLETGEKVTTTRVKEELEAKKEEILKIIEEIQNSDFKGKFGPWCSYCEFNSICPVYKVGKSVY